HLQELDTVAKALSESEARLQALFSNAAVGMAEITGDGRFELVNDALCHILGESRQRLLTHSLAQVAHGEERADLVAEMQPLVRGERDALVRELRFVRRDGEPIWVKLAI